MVDENQIKEWLKQGIINKEQATQMLKDSTPKKSEKESNEFFSIIAIIGAVLIFVGIAWLIAWNWNNIPDFVKVLILISSTIIAFTIGVVAREKNHEGVARALILLGAGLYLLSLFLISQIYNLATNLQHYAWILFLSWTVIYLTAYFLDSKENLLFSIILFFIWVVIQYVVGTENLIYNEEGLIITFILIFLSAGSLLFGLSSLHHSIQHKFTNMYRFWTVFYFLVVFYILSFQQILPIISEYTFESGAFTGFLIFFVILCTIGFIVGILFATNKNPNSLKEILSFIGIIVVLLIMIFSTKFGAGLVGTCNPLYCYNIDNAAKCNDVKEDLFCEWKNNYCMEVSCYNYNNEIECNNVQGDLSCEWRSNYCTETNCYNYNNETECNNALENLSCEWRDNYCITTKNWIATKKEISLQQNYERCELYNNQKDNCLSQENCDWNAGQNYYKSSIPLIIWFLWIVNNIIFIGFILLIIWYGQKVGSENIVNLGLGVFILDIITRYIGFWMDLQGYLAFSLLAIIGGILLIFGAWFVPKLRRKLLEQTQQKEDNLI